MPIQGEHNEAQDLWGGEPSAILGLVGFSQFMPYFQGLCNSFKGCALPASLLFHRGRLLGSCGLFRPHLKKTKRRMPPSPSSEVPSILLGFAASMLSPEAKGQGRELKRQARADILLGSGGVS